MTGLISVAEALRQVTSGLAPLASETVALADAPGRILAADLAARLTQPPFDTAMMDGFAVRTADIAVLPAALRLIDESAAGSPAASGLACGEAIRIFTGAPLPAGADTIVIQENARWDDASVTILEPAKYGNAIRPRGLDFAEGEILLRAGERLCARALSLAAAMNHGALAVRRRPLVAILATGDELVPPGAPPGPAQIISSTPVGIAAMVQQAGAEARILGIAKDTLDSLAEHIAAARDADILLTIGGVSEGEHDLVQQALRRAGMELDFWKIAMRPGKPLMHGRLGGGRVLGVPGNPVSALICARVFLVPMVAALLGREEGPEPPLCAILDNDIEANGSREHYMRGTLREAEDGRLRCAAAPSQDSGLLSPLARANCLIVRPPHAPQARAGEEVSCLRLDF